VPHPPTPAPQIWWFSSDVACSINLFTYLLTYLLDFDQSQARISRRGITNKISDPWWQSSGY